jgi:alpha-tubulin suppressor-like RCC1 family protein
LGELGDGRLLSSSIPVVVKGLSDMRQVAGGLEHTCAVSNGGMVYCWGKGLQGQLGTGGTPVFTKGPIALPIDDGRAVATGEAFSCAARARGVKCWGADDHGQLGNGTIGTAIETRPIDVVGLE